MIGFGGLPLVILGAVAGYLAQNIPLAVLIVSLIVSGVIIEVFAYLDKRNARTVGA